MNTSAGPERMYELECPHCESRLRCRERSLGGRVRCSHCKHEFKAPRLTPTPEPPPVAYEEMKRPPINRGSESSSATPPPVAGFPGIDTSQPATRSTAKSRRHSANPQPTQLSRQGIVGLAACGVFGLLLLLSAIGEIGNIYEGGLSGFNPLHSIARPLIVAVGGTLAASLYLMPTMVAYLRDHKNAVPIGIINAAFGWTFIGWIGTAAWPFSSDVAESRQTVRYIMVNENEPAEQLEQR